MFERLRKVIEFITGPDVFYQLQSQPRPPQERLRILCHTCGEDPCDPGCPYVRGDGGGNAIIYFEQGKGDGLANRPINLRLSQDSSYMLGRRRGDQQRLREETEDQAKMLARRLQASS